MGQREVEDIRACRVRGARWRAKARARQLRLHRRNCAWSARDFRAQTASTEKLLSVALSAHSPPLRIIRHRACGTLRLGKMQGLPRNISVIFQGSPPPPPSAKIIVVTAPPLLPGTSWTAMRIPRALQSCHNGAGSPPRPSMAASKMGKYGVHTAQSASRTSPPPPKKTYESPAKRCPRS